jgi:hypothetical protein
MVHRSSKIADETSIRVFFKTVRAVLGPILLLSRKILSPGQQGWCALRPIEEVNRQCHALTLNAAKTCPFCMKVWCEMDRLSCRSSTTPSTPRRPHRPCKPKAAKPRCRACITDTSGQSLWMYDS